MLLKTGAVKTSCSVFTHSSGLSHEPFSKARSYWGVLDVHMGSIFRQPCRYTRLVFTSPFPEDGKSCSNEAFSYSSITKLFIGDQYLQGKLLHLLNRGLMQMTTLSHWEQRWKEDNSWPVFSKIWVVSEFMPPPVTGLSVLLLWGEMWWSLVGVHHQCNPSDLIWACCTKCPAVLVSNSLPPRDTNQKWWKTKSSYLEKSLYCTCRKYEMILWIYNANQLYEQIYLHMDICRWYKFKKRDLLVMRGHGPFQWPCPSPRQTFMLIYCMHLCNLYRCSIWNEADVCLRIIKASHYALY